MNDEIKTTQPTEPRVMAATDAYLKSVYARDPAILHVVLFEDIAAALAAADAADPPYDVMSLDELREDREGIEATLRHAAVVGDKERAAHTVMQLDWYNRAIQWRLQNDTSP